MTYLNSMELMLFHKAAKFDISFIDIIKLDSLIYISPQSSYDIINNTD